MCKHTTYHYLCGHTSLGLFITCAVPTALLHHTSRMIGSHPALCPACSFTIFKTPALLPVVSHTTTSPTLAGIPVVLAIPEQPPPPYVPAASLNGILIPGMVLDSVPRDVRYEIIKGMLQPVNHFKAEDIGIGCSGKKGYNIYHGWDEGTARPGLAGKDAIIEEKIQNGVGDETAKDAGEIPGEVLTNSDILNPSYVEEVAAAPEREAELTESKS